MININGKEYIEKKELEKQEYSDNNYTIIRTYSAGVFAVRKYEELSEDGMKMKLFNSRMLWRWEGANALSQLAVNGVTEPEECRFTVIVPERIVTQVIEIIPCSDKATKSIESVEAWEIK